MGDATEVEDGYTFGLGHIDASAWNIVKSVLEKEIYGGRLRKRYYDTWRAMLLAMGQST